MFKTDIKKGVPCAIVALLLFAKLCIAGDLEATFARCCTLGGNWASEGLKCIQFPAPVAGVPAEEQSICLSAVEVCCIRTHREQMCESGKSAAEEEKDCIVDKRLGGEYHKDCCEACKLGMISGSMGNGCKFSKFSFGYPWDLAYQSCCLKTSPATSSPMAIPSSSSVPTQKQTSASPNFPTPELDSICDLLPGELCAHICIPIPGSYRCECPRGFTLMPDGKSCEQEDLPDRCNVNNPCSQKCFDTGVAVECSCHSGYQLQADERSCNDIDECQSEIDSCDHTTQICRNEPGSYLCENSDGSVSKPLQRKDKSADDNSGRCPGGYQFNFQSQVCDDIDECQLKKTDCLQSQVCQNTIGSYSCVGEGAHDDCSPGFRYNSVQKICRDINECAEATDNCDRDKQNCLNVDGGFTCQDRAAKSQCPAGYKFNKVLSKCEDINECEEQIDICNQESESCINEPGGYRCGPKLAETATRSTLDRNSCQTGYKMHPTYRSCVDINECTESSESPCDSNQQCVNTRGSFVCSCRIGFQLDPITKACVDINECQVNQHNCLNSQRCDNTIGSFQCIRFTSCGTGYTLNSQSGLCEDDDECALQIDDCHAHGPTWQCRNTAGSFRCEKKRCEPTFKLTNAGVCIGPDGRPHADHVGTTISRPISRGAIATTPSGTTTSLRTTQSSTECPYGYRFDQGECTDINECETRNICRKNQRCVNTGGSFMCINLLNCKRGFEMNEEATICIDIDECARNTHECSRGQNCVNQPGGYMCQCPPGHIFTSAKECVDVDECLKYAGQVCAANSDCENTIGSYRCNCKVGFKQAKDSKACEDLDECAESPGICQHTCVNVWGSYRCACRPGFTMNKDNRSCADVDECDMFRDRHICVGPCINQPGSYTCRCPEGYNLGSDGRTCQDIDECQGGSACPNPNEVCINTRGSYRCNTISCPPNFIKDTEHKNRCKRASLYCREGDQACIRLPLSYMFNFITFVSNLAIAPQGHLDLFIMRGPPSKTTTTKFNLEMLNTRAPNGIRKVTKNFFRIRHTGFNQAVISLVESIPGPQEIELQLTMDMNNNGVPGGSAVAKLFIFVSQYEY